MQWLCEICGYLHDDEDCPGSCPVCGAPSNKFSEFFEGDDTISGKVGDDIDDFDKDLFADYEDEGI